jgi:hypothetical protein
MFIGGCAISFLALEERHLRLADAAPPELNAVSGGASINIAPYGAGEVQTCEETLARQFALL